MRVVNTRQYFQDSLTELVGVRTGLAVPLARAAALLSETEDGVPHWMEGEAAEVVDERAEDFQSTFVQLLCCLGAIPDARTIDRLAADYCRLHADDIPVDSWLKDKLPRSLRVLQYVYQALLDNLVYGTALPEDLSATSGISQLLEEARPRHILTLMPQSRAWDGLLSLNDLFEGEHVASSPESYLDQRFIDYLAAQPGHLSAIHWRQFEHLTGEYFRRNGYIVRIGPGRRDGGVDVIAERTDVTVGPELVVIQCKRFGDNNPIGVDSVRAFWATVTDQNATRGLIATTSRLTIGAKDYCDARRYRLGAADAANVGQWLTQMARRPSRAG